MALISCAVLSALMHGTRPRQTFITCLFFGTGLYATGASWVYVSIHQYGQASMLLATLLTAGFAVALGLVFAIPLSLYGYLKRDHNGLGLFAFATLWVLSEWFRGWFLTGFPWLFLGYGFIDTGLAGWAPLTGILGLSGLVACSGAVIGRALMRADPPRITALAAILLTATWWGGGQLQKLSWTIPASSTPLTVALVQPNQPVLTKWREDALPVILADIRGKTLTLRNNNLVIFPESGIPALKNSVDNFLAGLDKAATNQQTAVITGIPMQSDTGNYFNGVIGLGLAAGSYQKRRLVPFGEYLPFEHWLRGLIAFFDLPMSSFSAGADQQALIEVGPFDGATFGVATAVCYEIAYSDQMAADARQANLLLTVSNDTWFGDSLGPHQHLQIARARALETGKPLIRVTNDGITAIIDERGEVLNQLPRFLPGILQGEVMPRSGATPYSRTGPLPLIVVCLVGFLLALALSRRRITKTLM